MGCGYKSALGHKNLRANNLHTGKFWQRFGSCKHYLAFLCNFLCREFPILMTVISAACANVLLKQEDYRSTVTTVSLACFQVWQEQGVCSPTMSSRPWEPWMNDQSSLPWVTQPIKQSARQRMPTHSLMYTDFLFALFCSVLLLDFPFCHITYSCHRSSFCYICSTG